jgi:hypothetical protein
MKETLSVILACFLISSCGGGRQEPPLKEEIENPEVLVEEQQKADETSKTGTGLIITSVVLGAGFAVSLLVNVGLGWRLWVITRPINLTELAIALSVMNEKLPNEVSIVRRALREALSGVLQRSR